MASIQESIEVRAATIFRHKIIIREQHLDSYGHVNNATYMELFDEARWEHSTQLGFGWEHVHQTGIGMIVLEARLKFRKEVKIRECIEIGTAYRRVRSRLFEVDQSLRNENGDLCCEAGFRVSLFRLKDRKIVAPSQRWLEAFGLGAQNIDRGVKNVDTGLSI